MGQGRQANASKSFPVLVTRGIPESAGGGLVVGGGVRAAGGGFLRALPVLAGLTAAGGSAQSERAIGMPSLLGEAAGRVRGSARSPEKRRKSAARPGPSTT